MKKAIAGLLVACALTAGTSALMACGGGGAPPPMVLNTQATFQPFVPVADTSNSSTTEATPIDEVM
jgi:hypothetical protein